MTDDGSEQIDDAETAVTRVDKYRVRVGSVVVTAMPATEARIRALTLEQLARFERIMGKGPTP